MVARVISLVLLVAVAAPVGCSDSKPGTSCAVGHQIGCGCAGGAAGVQICGDDGAYGACSCDVDTSTDDGVSTDVDSSVVAGDSVPPDAIVGEACDPCGYGSLRGAVCAPSEQIYVANARVTLHVEDCGGDTVTLTTYTDGDGVYYFPEVPCGSHRVLVDAGSFHNEYDVVIGVDHDTDLRGQNLKLCFAPDNVKIAVLWGQWDRMELTLDRLGLQYEYFNFEWDYLNDTDPADIEALQLLRDRQKLAAYDIVFFNCGSAALKWTNGFPEVKQNLAHFVNSGGSLYASDLSWAYLEGAFPDAFDFYGATDLPSVPMADDGPQQVEPQQSVPATVVDVHLAAYLGTGSFTAEFGSGPLIAVEGPGPTASVHVKGLVKIQDSSLQGYHIAGQPLVLSYGPGGAAGRIIYTTFHNEEQTDALMDRLLNYLVFLL